MEIIVNIETEQDMIIARRISANGFGRIDVEIVHKGHQLTIFPEYAILENLFTVSRWFR